MPLPSDSKVTTGQEGCHDKNRRHLHALNTTHVLTHLPAEDTLIDALRGCRHASELRALEQRLAHSTDSPPLFEWICDLLVQRRISRALAARLLRQLHHDG